MSSDILKYSLKKQTRLKKDLLSDKLRPFFSQIDLDSRGTLLIGPRGTGKTTFLISQLATLNNALYLTLDDLKLQNESISDLIE
jgi:predicted AAA+ superfamily ATPase